MADTDNDPKYSAVNVSMAVDTPVPHALGANFFQVTSTAGEFQLFIGSANVVEVTLARTLGAEAPPVRPQISHHFILSPEAFARLVAGVNEIALRSQEALKPFLAIPE